MRKISTIILVIFWLMTLTGCHSPLSDSVSNEVCASPPTNANAAEPAIAADAEGNVFVIYVEHGANKTADVYLQKFSGEAQPLGERVRINLEQGRATTWRGDAPTGRIAGDRTIYVGWTARVETSEIGGGSANDLYLSVSRDGGKTFDAPVKVNDDPVPAIHGMHSLEVDKNRRVYFAWLDERYLKNEPEKQPMQMNETGGSSAEMKHGHSEPNREVYFAASTDNGKSFSANKRIAGNVCPCCKTSMNAAPDGRLYVSWRQVLEGDFRHIAVASSTDYGESFNEPVIVSDDRWQIAGCPVSGASMATDKNNVLNIIWFTAGDAGKPGLYYAESKDGGKIFSPRALVYEGAVSGTPTLIPKGSENFTAFWSAAGKIYEQTDPGRRYNSIEPEEIYAGELPSATFVGFIKSENGKSIIQTAVMR